MIENLLNLLRQKEAPPVYEGRHRAEPPLQRVGGSDTGPVVSLRSMIRTGSTTES